jgi:pyruvate dehydrogenase E2 component (dihydrolipoamide acetyltransferase)
VLLNHPDLNAHIVEGQILRRFKDVNLGVAVDTPRGLMVPTIFQANRKSIEEISVEAKDLAKQAQAGTINPDLLQGGTFTVTNLGTLGVEMFTPVLNPPQTGILGVCNITTKLKGNDGFYKPYPAMGLSITYDHRAVDGAPAARFMQELTSFLENFSNLPDNK